MMMFSSDPPGKLHVKVPKHPKVEKKPPYANRNPANGDLTFFAPFHYDFMQGFRGCVAEERRQFDTETKEWLVDQPYARMTEDLLELFFPDIVIDYQGWWENE